MDDEKSSIFSYMHDIMLWQRRSVMFDEIHEECGVFGAYRVDNAASITYYGLHSLQHRGRKQVVLPFRMVRILLYKKVKG